MLIFVSFADEMCSGRFVNYNNDLRIKILICFINTTNNMKVLYPFVVIYVLSVQITKLTLVNCQKTENYQQSNSGSSSAVRSRQLSGSSTYNRRYATDNRLHHLQTAIAGCPNCKGLCSSVIDRTSCHCVIDQVCLGQLFPLHKNGPFLNTIKIHPIENRPIFQTSYNGREKFPSNYYYNQYQYDNHHISSPSSLNNYHKNSPFNNYNQNTHPSVSSLPIPNIHNSHIIPGISSYPNFPNAHNIHNAIPQHQPHPLNVLMDTSNHQQSPQPSSSHPLSPPISGHLLRTPCTRICDRRNHFGHCVMDAMCNPTKTMQNMRPNHSSGNTQINNNYRNDRRLPIVEILYASPPMQNNVPEFESLPLLSSAPAALGSCCVLQMLLAVITYCLFMQPWFVLI